MLRRKVFKPTDGDAPEAKLLKQELDRVKATMPREIIEAHAHCARNKAEIGQSDRCGCFYCLAVFPASHIEKWVDDESTALCPQCGIDAVIGDYAGYQLNKQFLGSMYAYWFG